MYYFIINPNSRSGRGKEIWNFVKADLDELMLEYKFYFTKYEFHATKIASYICKNVTGSKNIVVLGGDGTINEVMNGITDFENVTLSYIPSGSSNDFARSLGIPSNPKDALSIALSPKKQVQADIGEVEILDSDGQVMSSRRFAVSCGIGYDAAICHEAQTSRLKKILNALKLGKLTYGLIAAKQVLCYKTVSADIIIDGAEPKRFNNILFFVNMVHPYEGGGAKLAPNANYADQKLSVCFVHNLKRWQVLFLLPTAFVSKHTFFSGVEVFDCHEIEIIQDDPKVTHTDGEYCGDNKHIRLCCNRLSIKVNVPE